MHIAIRLLWLLGIGWWLAPIWFGIACLLMVTIVGWPLALVMFQQTWTVLTLDLE